MARKGDEPLSRSSGCETAYVTDTSLCHMPGVIPFSSELASKEGGGSYLGLKPSHPPGRCCTPLAIRFPVQVRLHAPVSSTLVPLLAFHSILATSLLHGDSALTAPGWPGKSQQPLETLRAVHY